jgi:hypothetical protein
MRSPDKGEVALGLRSAAYQSQIFRGAIQSELGFIRERQRVGIEAAKAKGIYKGRPVTLDHPSILAMRREGKGATEIAKVMGCSRGAVYKVLNGNSQRSGCSSTGPLTTPRARRALPEDSTGRPKCLGGLIFEGALSRAGPPGN